MPTYKSFLSFKSKVNIDIETETLLIYLDKIDIFKEKRKFKIFKIDSTITKIHGFTDYFYLTQITIPNSVVEICEKAFSNCKSLIHKTTPNSVTLIDEYAFKDCVFKADHYSKISN